MTYGGITLYASGFQQNSVIGAYKNPLLTPQLHIAINHTDSGCASPVSLAVTKGIFVNFFSSPY